MISGVGDVVCSYVHRQGALLAFFNARNNADYVMKRRVSSRVAFSLGA